MNDAATAPPTRVLIAEDEALIRLDLKEMLVEEGFDVVAEVADGASAVRLTRELRPDLVILDVKMPVMDGIAAAEQIANERLAAILTSCPRSRSQPTGSVSCRGWSGRSTTSRAASRPGRSSSRPRAGCRTTRTSPSPRPSASSRSRRWSSA